MMTFKKLFAGSVSGLVVLGGFVALNNCTVTVVDCAKDPTNPVCLRSDSSTNPDTSTGDSAADTGGGNDGAADGGTCAAIPTLVDFSDDACNKCAGDKCCAEVTACWSETGMGDQCVDYDDCLALCDGLDGGALNSCIMACDQTHPMSKPKWVTYQTCITQKCGSVCN